MNWPIQFFLSFFSRFSIWKGKGFWARPDLGRASFFEVTKKNLATSHIYQALDIFFKNSIFYESMNFFHQILFVTFKIFLFVKSFQLRSAHCQFKRYKTIGSPLTNKKNGENNSYVDFISFFVFRVGQLSYENTYENIT